MRDEEIQRIQSDAEKAKGSLSELKEVTGFALDSVERVGLFSKRTVGVGLGAAIGVVLGILCVAGAAKNPLTIPSKYEDLLVLAMGIGGASAGALLVKESGEEKARRLENAASRMGDDPGLAGFKKNILEEHRLITRANASRAAELDKEARQQYLLQPATQSEFAYENKQQIPQIEQPPTVPPEQQ